MSLQPSNDVQRYQERGLTILQLAETMVIQSQDSLDEAGRILTDGKRLENEITAHHKPIKQRMDEAKREVLDAERRLLEPIQKVRSILQPKVLDYQRAERARAQEEARRFDEERHRAAEEERIQQAERLAAQGSERAGEAILSVPVVIPPTPVIPTRTQGVAEVKRWRAEVIDFALLSDKFKIANQPVLDSLARAVKGAYEEPGVKWICETSLSVRSSAPAISKAPPW
jgi:hypothetical protein